MAAPQALTPEQIQQIIAAGRGNTVNIGGTLYGANYADTGSGETLQEGALSGITGSTGIDAAGQPFYSYDPTGALTGQGTTKASQSFFGGLADAFKDPVVLAALGGAGYAGLFGGGAAGAAGLTASELAAADMALGGVGGTLGAEALAGAATAGAGASALSSLTPAQIANLAKAGINVAGLLGATNAISNMGGGNTSTTATPVTYSGGGAGGYSPEYFSQLQSNYNSLMPNVPRDVASPLQNWYSTEFNPGASVTGSLFGGMTGGTTAGGMAPNTGVKPITTPVVKPTTVVPTTTVPTTTVPTTTVPTTTVPTTTTPATVVNPGSAGYQYATNQLGLTPAAYLNNINQWILDNPRASRDQIDAAMAQAGVSQADLQEALRTTTFSDATKYALTSGGSLGDLNNIITNYIEQNPTATNEQIQAQQTQYGISDQDIERAMTALNSSPAKEYAVINDMGLNQYYQNIADVAKSGVSAADAAAQMRQYGVSPGDVSRAYGLFAPSGGLTLDEVLAAYNK
jgi:uncharacterized protein YneF (UPF0154 family)